MKYYLENPDGSRSISDEWTYRVDMATKAYEHVIATDSLIIYRRWSVTL